MRTNTSHAITMRPASRRTKKVAPLEPLFILFIFYYRSSRLLRHCFVAQRKCSFRIDLRGPVAVESARECHPQLEHDIK